MSVVSDGDTLQIEGSAQVESIVLRQQDLKGHILSGDFFAADQHPEIAFRSTDVQRDGEALVVEGDLTIKGITNHVVAKGTLGEPVENLAGKTVAGLSLEATVDRTAYGLNWNADLPNGGKALGNDVRIAIEAELVREDA